MTIINTVNNGAKVLASNNAAKHSSSTAGEFASLLSSSVNNSSVAASVANINSPSTVHLAMVDPDEQSKQQGKELLSQLQRLKLRLIHGQLNDEELEELSLALENAILPDSPATRQIIAEIRTRVAVELAKYNKV